MTITEISRSYSVKQSDGNYGSKDYFCSLSAEVGPEEDVEEVSSALFARCKEMVEKEMAKAVGSRNILNSPTVPIRSFGSTKIPWEELQSRKAEQSKDYGLDNGPKGSKFEDSFEDLK